MDRIAVQGERYVGAKFADSASFNKKNIDDERISNLGLNLSMVRRSFWKLWKCFLFYIYISVSGGSELEIVPI